MGTGACVFLCVVFLRVVCLCAGVCFLLRRGSNTASSFLNARDKQPQVRLFTSIYDFTRIHVALD